MGIFVLPDSCKIQANSQGVFIYNQPAFLAKKLWSHQGKMSRLVIRVVTKKILYMGVSINGGTQKWMVCMETIISLWLLKFEHRQFVATSATAWVEVLHFSWERWASCPDMSYAKLPYLEGWLCDDEFPIQMRIWSILTPLKGPERWNLSGTCQAHDSWNWYTSRIQVGLNSHSIDPL